MAGLTLQSVEPEADRCFTAPSHYSIFCQSMLLVVMMTNIANQLQPSGDDDHLVGDYSERDQSPVSLFNILPISLDQVVMMTNIANHCLLVVMMIIWLTNFYIDQFFIGPR